MADFETLKFDLEANSNTQDQQGSVRGLGDVIAGITSAIGIEPCGACKERQQYLNQLLPTPSSWRR